MGSIVSAITGSGATKGADAQVTAYGEAMETAKKTLNEQLALGWQALRTQQEMFNTAIEMGEPYRNAGNTAMARYESLLYGIPIGETSTYKAAANPSQGKINVNYVGAGFDDQFRKLYAANKGGPGGKRIGQQLYYDTKTGQVGYSGDIDLGLKTKDAAVDTNWRDALAGAKAKINEAGSSAYTPEYDMSTFGDPTQKFSFEPTPGYEFRRDEGQKALERSAAARSGALSGAQLKATERYGQEYATAEFDNVLNRLSGLINTGANMSGAAGNQAISSGNSQAGTLGQMADYWGTYGENVGSLKTAVGQARASGYLGQQAAGTNLINTGMKVAGMFL